ncbi:MAG: endonuclease MutS2 [Clostridiaceae bacterium]|nr:endonuclease MutS2 [Clostridiaceae bacterium]
MNNKTLELLEFDKIKEIIKGYALSEDAKEQIQKLEPYLDINIIEKNMNETMEARAIVNINSSIPIHSLSGIKHLKEKINKGGILFPEELGSLCGLLKETKKLKRFMLNKNEVAPIISTFALSTYELNDLVEEIEKSIDGSRVTDKASGNLSKLRKRIIILEDRIKSKLDTLLRNAKYKNFIRDALVSQRNGRYVIPVKSEYKNNIEGDVLDKSGSGSTVFIEPEEIKRLQNELNIFKIEEENEVYKILAALTVLVTSYEREININIETMSYYDFLFAKGKYSKTIDGRSVKLNTSNYIKINKGRHPLIGSNVVPLDFEVGKAYNSVVITGPNTGGKTVALKTVGLLTIMAQCGLQVPVAAESEFAIFLDVLADIGDGQSIEQNLSTFSSHITNIINILNTADKYTLVIMDEIGAGTDPGEGMGIAVSVLEEIYKKGSIILATTHYSEIKEFALKNQGFINGCMEFDIETLKPLYKLSIGKPGESNAFLIALRLGMNKLIIERAHLVTYKEKKNYEDYKTEIILKPIIEEDHKEKIIKLQKINKISEKQKAKSKFNIGDSVYITFMKRSGIICELENSKGDYGVMVMKKKLKINNKRLSLYILQDELYPEDYDFDIIFESVENRKKDKIMSRKHVDGIKIVKEDF